MQVGHYIHDWGHAASRAVLYGSLSVGLGWIPGKGRHISQWCMYRWSKGVAEGLEFDITVRGTEILDGVPQAVFVANHLSAADIIVLGSFLRHDYRWLAKAPLFKVPFSGWHLRFAGHVPVYRGEQRKKNRAIGERINDVVAEGASLLFFPEGTRSETGKLRQFRIGAFRTATHENLPVVPLVIRGTHGMMKKNAAHLDHEHDFTASVTVLPPLQPTHTSGDDKGDAAELMARTHAAFAAELGPDLVEAG